MSLLEDLGVWGKPGSRVKSMGQAMKLTEQMIKALSAEPGKRLSIPVEGCDGLELRVSGAGAKAVRSWSYRYRPPGSTVPQRITIGRWPAVSLADAKKATNKHKGNLGDGRDPKHVERHERQRAGGGKPFSDVYVAFLKAPKKNGLPRSMGTVEQYTMAMARDGGPLELWGPWPVGTITRSDIMDYLDAVDQRGLVARNRTQTMVQAIFSFAVRRGEIERNPLEGVGKQHAEGVRTRVLNAKELGVVWRDLLNPKSANSLLVRLALRLIALTACRVSEVADAEHVEISLSGEPMWVVPGERSKNGKAHRIPLVPQMVRIIGQASDHVVKAHGRPVDWVFPASGLYDRAVTRYALRDACWAIADRLQMPRFSPHDLRRSWTQIALRLRVPPHIIDMQLGHKSGGAMSDMMRVPELSDAFKHYGLDFDYADERREALSKVAAFIDDLALES